MLYKSFLPAWKKFAAKKQREIRIAVVVLTVLATDKYDARERQVAELAKRYEKKQKY